MPKRKVPHEAVEEENESLQPHAKQRSTATLHVADGGATSPANKRRTKRDTIQRLETAEQVIEAPKRARNTRVVKLEAVEEQEAVEGLTTLPAKRKSKAKQEIKQEGDVEDKANFVEKKVKKKRKTKEEKEAEMIPLAQRTVGHKLFIGAHVSAAGGVHNAVTNSVHIGANAFALFLKSQRKWSNPPLVDEHCVSFHNNCKQHSYDQMQHVVPHGSYLVNLAHTDKARTDQAYESYLDDLQRCERLGIQLYNIHPGNTVNNDRVEAIAHLAKNINRAHEETTSVITLLENMAAGGNILGTSFEDLRDIIAQVKNKSRIGVCIDTCHAFAAGYDLRSPAAFKATFDKFDDVVGFRYLRALHVNDSKAPLQSHRDLHANIGTGFLGLRAFHNLVNDARFEGIPLVLETPIEVRTEDGEPVKDDKGKEKEDKSIWAREIKVLESLVGMATDSAEFVEMEKQLARKGESERKRINEQVEKRKDKDKVKAEKNAKRGKKKDEKPEKEESNSSEASDHEDNA